jgi:hypothetical protein
LAVAAAASIRSADPNKSPHISRFREAAASASMVSRQMRVMPTVTPAMLITTTKGVEIVITSL